MDVKGRILARIDQEKTKELAEHGFLRFHGFSGFSVLPAILLAKGQTAHEAFCINSAYFVTMATA